MMTKRFFQKILAGLVCGSIVLGMAGCASQQPVGPINDRATVALLRFENVGDGISGIVYRQVDDFEAFLAQSQTPLLVVFYASRADVNTRIIPALEQMADDEQGRLQIVWIDANAESKLADSFSVEMLPQFTVVDGGALKRSMLGFDEDGVSKLRDLVEPYLNG
jgi:thioredoxin 1